MPIRRAIITGSSSGIGAATAELLAKQGYAVWLTYTGGEAAGRAVADRCIAAGAPDVRLSRLDLRSPESIDALVAEVTASWGELHVLVNNGGVCPYTSFEDITIDDWDAVMETNGRGTFLLSRATLPLLRLAQQNRSDADRSIINLSSIAGQVGALKTGMHYAASKGAILAITRSFARLLADERIRVNAVTPGPVVSAITDNLTGQSRASLESSIPLGKFGEPEDVAWIIASLAAPEARFVTGATYDVNGGVRID
ncbi:SDR family NAD(P)-dependent oxidoreductase [Salinibacterium sp. M195]|uniref:SDR family NAD(P)-dependent oxidoreductase n=1 Tax=Salinibacterium sp. M195 TaxID=2583374 RepID=UPI001C633FF4|nr:SDR family oxidoreductase [Salinibacterium sp. M195]QYH36360.1 SDR family oxidoreductase [Salinibacterium sp. M195]